MNYDYYYQCDPNHLPPVGSPNRGVTTWERSTPFQIPAGQSHPESFTCTIPRCYYIALGAPKWGQDSCNISFKAVADSLSGNNDIFLHYYVNGKDTDNGSWISKQPGHGARQTFDISQTKEKFTGVNCYNDMMKNTFTIQNTGDVSVTVSLFRVLRIYKVCGLGPEQYGYCNSPGTSECSDGDPVGNDGTLDYARVDKPCNYEQCGTFSVTLASDKTHVGSIIWPGESRDWYFDWKPYSQYNYRERQKCLFNFNQIWPYNNDATTDIQLDAYINGQPLATYYLSKQTGHGLFPSYDLVEDNTAYIDTGCNHIRLTNNGTAPVQMGTSQIWDGINIYRVYQTYNPCGPYTDHSDNPHSDCPPYSDHSDTYSDHSDSPPSGTHTVHEYMYVNEGLVNDWSYEVTGNTYQTFNPPDGGGYTLYAWIINGVWGGNLENVWCPDGGDTQIQWYFQ